MYDVDTDLEAALAGPHRPCSRLLSLSASGATVQTWESEGGILTGGSVSYDRSAYVRRTGSVDLANADGSLSPTSTGDRFYPGSRFRVERGAILGGVRTYAPLATLVVTGFGASMDGRLRVSGQDPLSLLAQPFGEVVVIPEGTTASLALRTLWGPVLDPDGMGADWTLDDDGRSCPMLVYLEDEDRLAVGVELMSALGLQVFADRFGEPVLRPIPDPTSASATIVREYEPGATSVLIDLSRSGDRRPYNRVIVDVMAPDRDPIRAVVDITDTASPLHADRIGVQTAPIYRTTRTMGQSAAIAVGQALLVEYALSNDRITSSIVPDIAVDEDDVVSFDESVSGSGARYRIDRISHPIVMGASSIEASRVLPVMVTA